MTEDQRNKIMKIARLVAVLVVIAVGLYGYISQNKKKEDAVNTPSSDAVSATETTTEEETTTEAVANTTTETTTEQSAENTTTETVTEETTESNPDDFEYDPKLYSFRRQEFLDQHFEKHGGEFDYATKEEYVAGANRVIQNPKALHKTEAEDGDDIYFIEETSEFVVVSTDGYIRTYFIASGGIDYYNRQ